MLQSTLGTLSSHLPDYPVDIPHGIQTNFKSYTRNMMLEWILWNTVDMIYYNILKYLLWKDSPMICNGKGFFCIPFCLAKAKGRKRRLIKITFCQKLYMQNSVRDHNYLLFFNTYLSTSQGTWGRFWE